VSFLASLYEYDIKTGSTKGFSVEIAVIQGTCQSGLFLARLQEIQGFLAMICEDYVR
jgi:hypothetical protein